MQKSKILSFLFLIGIFFAACQKDSLNIMENPIDPPVITNWEATINGTVSDVNNNALASAVVHVGDKSVVTDEHGRFSITGLVNSEKAIITISKQGYFDNYPVFYPEKGYAQEVRIQLRERIFAGSVNNGTNSIELQNQRVDFGTSKFKNMDGSPYTGTVNVYMDYLDPTDPNLNAFMPGDLVGINSENEEQILKSYGMFNVELEDQNGNSIELDGQATLKMELPSELSGVAPSSIPLWYFDIDTGNWIEDGMAILVGNAYVGTVTHFTLWNCDDPYPLITINGFITTSGQATALTVRITRANGDSRTTVPNARGYFEGKVPQDEVLLFEILGVCEEVIYFQNIGGYSSDENLGGFNIESDLSIITVSGNAVDCDMDPVSNGYVMINVGSSISQFTSVQNGAFSAEFITCNEDPIIVTVFDLENAKSSNPQEFPYSPDVTTGLISACEVDLPPVGFHIDGPDVDYFIPATGGVTTATSGFTYEMTLLDNFDNGDKRIYTVTVLNWTGEVSDPVLHISYTTLELGDPGDIVFVDSLGTQGDVILDPTPGGLFDAQFSDCTIEVIDDQGVKTSYPNHSIRLVGIFN